MNGEKKRVGVRVDPSTWSIDEWKKAVTRVEVNGTYVVCNGPGFVLAENITADNTGPGTICIHDGQNVADRRVWYDQAVANHGHGQVFKVPIYCSKGITVIIAAAAYGSIQWLPWHP